MRKATRTTLAAAAGALLVVCVPTGPATAAGWEDLSGGWQEASVEDMLLFGATCDFDGDGPPTYYSVAPAQSISVRVMVRWGEAVELAERDVKMWMGFDALEFTSDGESPETFYLDARTMMSGHLTDNASGQESGSTTMRGHGSFTDSDGVALYRGPWQVESVVVDDVLVDYSLIGPCLLDLRDEK